MQPVRRRPTYKQMAFETAVRNPERYKDILSIISKYEGQILDDKTLLDIVCELYILGIVTSPEIKIDENTQINDIKSLVISVNSTRRADGGYPSGYASRFWTYLRTPCELNMVFARYNKKLIFSNVAKKLISGEYDEQEVFSIQSMKYNRKSPYRNVSNDFNYFVFIVKVLLEHKQISYEQFIVSLFSENGSINEFLDIINTHAFPDINTTIDYVREKYSAKNEDQTISRDYPDVVLRLLRITGFVTIISKGKTFISLNENKKEYILDLLKIPFSYTEEEKLSPELFFKAGEKEDKQFFDIIKIHRNKDILDGEVYKNQLLQIIKQNNLTPQIICEAILELKKEKIEAFKYIPHPLKIEFYISLLLAIQYGEKLSIKPNYKPDSIGMPISHAPGNCGDIEVFNDDVYWLIEVTLIRNKAQQLNNETTSVLRHFQKEVFQKRKFLSFVAPFVHEDTEDFYKYSLVKNQNNKAEIFLKPYSFEEFIKTTLNKNNMLDMKAYSDEVIEDFKRQFDQ